MGSPASVDGIGTAASFTHINDLAVDHEGNVYLNELGSYTVRKITPAGVVTTIAGTNGIKGYVDGAGADARFGDFSAMAADAAGNLYVVELYSYSIRKITPAGVVSTLAGKTGNVESRDGIGTAASFKAPYNIAIDAGGNAYVDDFGVIRKVTPTGVVTTLAGNQTTYGRSVDGIGTSAAFTQINGITADRSGNIYVAEFHAVRKITPTGVVTTLAGTATSEYNNEGSVDGKGATARFWFLKALTVDESGNLYAADGTKIRKITPDGTVSTLAGLFSNPSGVAVDRTGNVYVSEISQNVYCLNWIPCGPAPTVNVIRKISPDGVVTTLAGTRGIVGSTDGKGAAASFNIPIGIAVDDNGNVFVADTGNNTIRKITPDGVVSTVAGKPGSIGVSLGALPASLSGPWGLAIDSNGVLFATSENAVLKIVLE